MTDSQKPDYYAYLLRLWREGEDAPWRASLENPHTGERSHFANPQRAFAHIEAQINQPPGGVEPGEPDQNMEDYK